MILEMNGKAVKDCHDLLSMVPALQPGEKAIFKAFRDGKETFFTAIVAEMKGERESSGGLLIDKTPEATKNQLGISLQAVAPEIAAKLGMKKAEGVVVMDITLGSPAADTVLQRGDIIIEVEKKPVSTVEEFNDALRNAKLAPFTGF